MTQQSAGADGGDAGAAAHLRGERAIFRLAFGEQVIDTFADNSLIGLRVRLGRSVVGPRDAQIRHQPDHAAEDNAENNRAGHDQPPLNSVSEKSELYYKCNQRAVKPPRCDAVEMQSHGTVKHRQGDEKIAAWRLIGRSLLVPQGHPKQEGQPRGERRHGHD